MASPQRFRRSYLPFWLEVPGMFLARLLYHVRSRGVENIPAQGGVLLIANHISYVDAVVLQLACPRPIHFVGYDGFQHAHWFAHWLFRVTQTIPISPRKSLNSTRRVLQALKAGAVVCSFPEGAISRTGQLMALRPGFEMMARRAGVPVVPVAHDGLWGSVFSFVGNKYLWKSPRLMPTPVFIVFGRPIPPDRIDVAGARNALLDLAVEAFHERPILRRHLARETVRALAKRPRHLEIVDRTAERREITAAQLLATAAALSRHIRRTIPGRRVGIVLPPGIGATLANLAIACAGKVPVNLNFTLGRAALESCLRLGEIRTILTADAVKAKVPTFPWTEDTRDLRAEIVAAGGKRAILPWLLAAWLLPNQWFPALLGLPKVGDNEEAVLLFTSGSSGEPKGVVLTHRNIIANCAQLSSLAILPDRATLIACLPVFHSFGCTVTVWYPILRGCHVVTVPSPLDTRKIIDAIRDERATVMVGAPTFIRPFLKKAEKSELSSLELIATGAEKLPMDLYDGFLRQFGIEVMQCYGITETSPAANVNQPDPPVVTRTGEPQLGKRAGSVGRLMPGMSARIVDPETGAELPSTSTGMLLLKGANVFTGYLRDPEKTADALRDGWFVTGDLGRFDDDGFLYIEGRISRFSKIGGEMVPHGTVEQKIIAAFGWEATETPTMAVVGVPDPVKGEQLVLITTHEIATDQVRERLLAAGLPALWIPKIIRRVETVPLLGSGKLDLKSCKAIALQACE
jgi:acyl-[acyl-carrier-protein]-phospholipid O-acyltransferase / long-chain-fatty-acid--[acyl-carrier-protein] ligase